MRNVFAVAAVLRRISAHMVHDVGPSISRSESGWGREGKGHVFKTENNCHVCEEKVMWWQRHTNSICKWRRQFQRQNWQRSWRSKPLSWHLHDPWELENVVADSDSTRKSNSYGEQIVIQRELWNCVSGGVESCQWQSTAITVRITDVMELEKLPNKISTHDATW